MNSIVVYTGHIMKWVISVQFVKWPRDKGSSQHGQKVGQFMKEALSYIWAVRYTVFNGMTTTDQLSLLMAFIRLGRSICVYGVGERDTHTELKYFEHT
jgi:hypothetical protein